MIAAPKNVEILANRFAVVTDRNGLFLAHLRSAELLLDKCVRVQLANHQKEALLSLLCDVVAGRCHSNGVRFEDSDLLRAINAESWQLAAAQFQKWVYVGKLVDAKTWMKRDAEQVLFRRGSLPS